MTIESQTDEVAGVPPAGTPVGDSPLRFVEGDLRRPGVSLPYRMSLVLVSLATILLAAIYFGLIGLAAYGIYYYATDYTGIMAWEVHNAAQVILKVLLCLVPFLIGFL